MSKHKYIRVPPTFSDLKKQAEQLANDKERLNFWLRQKRDYITESSWKMKKVDVISGPNFYPTETLKRRQKRTETTGEDHNLRSINSEIELLKETVSHEDISEPQINIPKLIEEIAEERSKKDSAKFSKEMIVQFLSVHIETKGSVETERDKAIEQSEDENVTNELIDISKGNLYNLRKALKERVEQISSHFTKK